MVVTVLFCWPSLVIIGSETESRGKGRQKNRNHHAMLKLMYVYVCMHIYVYIKCIHACMCCKISKHFYISWWFLFSLCSFLVIFCLITWVSWDRVVRKTDIIMICSSVCVCIWLFVFMHVCVQMVQLQNSKVPMTVSCNTQEEKSICMVWYVCMHIYVYTLCMCDVCVCTVDLRHSLMAPAPQPTLSCDNLFRNWISWDRVAGEQKPSWSVQAYVCSCIYANAFYTCMYIRAYLHTL